MMSSGCFQYLPRLKRRDGGTLCVWTPIAPRGSGVGEDRRVLDLISTVIECWEGRDAPGPVHPPAVTARVAGTLRRLLREGAPWRSLTANAGAASRSTLRRHLVAWTRGGVLALEHALLVAMLPGDPTLILDSCTVGAKREGELTGLDPTDRGKQGTEYRILVTGDGLPIACLPTAANVNNTVALKRRFLAAFAVLIRIMAVLADKDYDAEANRVLCRAFGAETHVHKRGRPHGSGLGRRRWPVERSNAWVLEHRRLALRCDRLGFMAQSLLHTAWILLIVGRLVRGF